LQGHGWSPSLGGGWVGGLGDKNSIGMLNYIMLLLAFLTRTAKRAVGLAPANLALVIALETHIAEII